MRIRTRVAAVLLATALIGLPRAAAADDNAALPDPGRTLLVNALLPGTAQAALGDPRLGRRILAASLTPGAAGTALLVYDQVRSMDGQTAGLGVYRVDGRTYLLPPPEDASLVAGDWVFSTGLILSTWGSLVSAWSQWAAYREFADRLGLPAPRRGHEPLGALLAAPYRPRNVFNADVMPFFPISVLGQLHLEDLAVYGRYFRQERVDFWGVPVHPLTGLALNTVATLALVHANAAAEELLYRGLQLETRGIGRSSISFGLAHLPNMLLPGVSVEETVYQSLFAALFGLYAAQRTAAGGYRLERAVALHFWHNVAALTLGYLERGGSQGLTAAAGGVGIRMRASY